MIFALRQLTGGLKSVCQWIKQNKLTYRSGNAIRFKGNILQANQSGTNTLEVSVRKAENILECVFIIRSLCVLSGKSSNCRWRGLGLGVEELHDELVLFSDIFPFVNVCFLMVLGMLDLGPLACQASTLPPSSIPSPTFLLGFTLLRIHCDWEALMASGQCVASLGFALVPIPILCTLFYFRVLWIENLESKLWSLCPCLSLLIKCIGSLFFLIVKNNNYHWFVFDGH